jgi:YegS/Rv2252/BmrU family lipid kinase
MKSRQRKISFLFNPVSGSGIKDSLLKKIENRCIRENVDFEFLATRIDGDYSSLEESVRRNEVTDIVVIGGDGTFNQVCKALRHTGVNFGIIPMGSGNGLALGAGIPRNTQKALEVIFRGHAQAVDGFLVNGRFSCMLSGIGFDAAVAAEFASSKRRGLWTYVRITAENFLNARTFCFRIRSMNEEFDTNAYFISIANSNQFGNSFTIAPKARLNDGLIDIIIVRKMNKLQLLLAILHQLKFGDVQEKIFREKQIIYFQTTELQIENPERAPLHIDGDPEVTAEHLSIRVIPDAFRLLQ